MAVQTWLSSFYLPSAPKSSLDALPKRLKKTKQKYKLYIQNVLDPALDLATHCSRIQTRLYLPCRYRSLFSNFSIMSLSLMSIMCCPIVYIWKNGLCFDSANYFCFISFLSFRRRAVKLRVRMLFQGGKTAPCCTYCLISCIYIDDEMEPHL